MLSTRRSRVTAALGGLLALLAAPLAVAGMGRHAGGCTHGAADADAVVGFVRSRVDATLDELEASPDQREAVHAIVDGAVPEVVALRERAASVRTALSEAIAQGADRGTVETLRAEGTQLFDEATQAATDRLLDVREVLTPAQWQALTARHERLLQDGPRWGHGHHGWR